MGAKLRERTRMTPSLSSPEWPEPLRKLAKNAAQLRNVVALKLQYRKEGRIAELNFAAEDFFRLAYPEIQSTTVFALFILLNGFFCRMRFYCQST